MAQNQEMVFSTPEYPPDYHPHEESCDRCSQYHSWNASQFSGQYRTRYFEIGAHSSLVNSDFKENSGSNILARDCHGQYWRSVYFQQPRQGSLSHLRGSRTFQAYQQEAQPIKPKEPKNGSTEHQRTKAELKRAELEMARCQRLRPRPTEFYPKWLYNASELQRIALQTEAARTALRKAKIAEDWARRGDLGVGDYSHLEGWRRSWTEKRCSVRDSVLYFIEEQDIPCCTKWAQRRRAKKDEEFLRKKKEIIGPRNKVSKDEVGIEGNEQDT